MMVSLASQQTVEFTESACEAAEAYMQWMRTDLASGRWQADPTRPCLLYKVYSSVERIPLDTHIPLRLGMSYEEALRAGALPVPRAEPERLLSWLLYYAHGLTRLLRPEAGVSPLRLPQKKVEVAQRLRSGHYAGPLAHSAPFLGRPVPSGGSLHPTELYLALGAGWRFPPGVYHYDSAHHALERLRTGDYTATLAACLAAQNQQQAGSLHILLTACFQKNHQKYTNLSYWLQTLDAGVLAEQLRWIARCLQLPATLALRYADAPLHHLLGLDTSEENVYAVLSLEAGHAASQANTGSDARQQSVVLPALNVPHVQPFIPIPRSELLTRLHAASLLDQPSEGAAQPVPPRAHSAPEDERALVLPAVQPGARRDIAQTLLRRRTASNALASRELRFTELAALLAPLQEGPGSLLESCHFQLYCALSRVEAVPQGVYLYREHALVPVYQASILPILSRISTGINIFPHLAPVNLFLCADYREALKQYGPRGLRMLGIEMGRVLQRLSLAAAASDLATHIHQSFHIEGTRKVLLRQPSPYVLPLASMMAGHPRSSQGGLFEAAWY